VRNTPDFVAHVVELMKPARAVAKAMFGGHGLYVDGLFVAIVAEDVLYLKCDALRAPEFDALGLPPFVYAAKDGKTLVTKYRRAPDEALESPAEMQRWLRLAVASALARGNRGGRRSATGRAKTRRAR
jgi:DNA transformation protein